ncbi:hypothetical protein GX441_05810 [bacterium]|nr:hypothetical protein [bacterium]
MLEWLFKKRRSHANNQTLRRQGRLLWLIACAAISALPLLIELLYILCTRLPARFIVTAPSIPAIAVIWCALTIYDIARLEKYKREPFLLLYWMLAFAGLALLDIAGYVIFLVSGLPYLLNLIILVPVGATVAACFWGQRYIALLETERAREDE